MLALLNQFSLTQVVIGGFVIVGLNTVMLRWAMSRLQADPRDDSDPADRDAEILGDERARSSVATPRPRRLQSSAAGSGKSLAEAGLGAAETGAGAEMLPIAERAGALRPSIEEAAPALPGGAFAKAQLNPTAKATASLASRPAAGKPSAKPEPVVAKAGTSPVAEPAGMPSLSKSDLISIDKPGPSLPTVSSGQIAPSSPAKPADAPVSGKPEFGLIEPTAKSDEPDDVKKTKTIKSSTAAPAAVASGLTLIPPPTPAETKSEAKKAAAVVPPLTPAPAPVEAKKPEPLPVALPKEAPAAPKEAITAIAPKPAAEVPAPAAVKAEPAAVVTPAVDTEAATVAPVSDAPAKSFWRPRIFLPIKQASSKAPEPAEAKPAVETAPVAAVPAVEKLAEAGAALVTAKVALDAEKAVAAKVEAPVAEKPPVVAEKPPVVAEKPPVVAEKAPVVAEKPPVVAEKPPVIAEKPPVVAEKPPVVAEKPPVVAEKAPVVAEKPPVVAEKPPVIAEKPAPILPVLPVTPPVPKAEPVPAPAAALIPAAVREVSSTTTKPVMSTETTANRASAQLTLSFEITSLQLTPFFKLGGVQIRPLSNVVSLHLISAQASDSPMAAGISFEIDKVELDDQSNLRSLLLKPLGQAQAASTPQSKLQVDAVQITQGGEGAIQVTSSQSASTAVQLISLLTIASMEFTPSFEIGSLRLEPNSKSVQLRLAPSQRAGALDLPPSFEISSIQLGNEAQFSLLSLTPSAK
jgi:hypothetical protein